MKFVTKVEIKRNFYIARSRIRGDYLIRVNGGSTEKIDQMDNQMQKVKWSQTISANVRESAVSQESRVVQSSPVEPGPVYLCCYFRPGQFPPAIILSQKTGHKTEQEGHNC